MRIIKRLSEPKNVKLFAFCWTGVIFYLCLSESTSLPNFNFEYKDKIIHFTFYFVFVLLWYRSNLKLNKGVVYLRNVFLLAILLGVLIEVMQKMFTKTRTFDWFDILANTIGAFSCFVFIRFFNQAKKDT